MTAVREGDFVFAQPRLQARHAALLAPERWAELEQITGFSQFLQSVRATPLSDVVEPFGALSDEDEMETALRDAFAARVAEIASWLPPDWQPAVLHLRTLFWIPFHRHRRLHGAPRWMRRKAARDEAEAGRDAEEKRGEKRDTDNAPAEDAESWLKRWQALWPGEVAGLGDIGRRLTTAAHPDLGGDSPWPERRARLAAYFSRAFRRHAFGPGAVFAQLGLLCLEFGRLRGNLTARRAGLIV